jgi:hypothetical protein
MAITYPVSLPTVEGIAEITLTAQNVVGTTESPFTFAQQTFKHPGERWTATVTITPSQRDRIEPWIAFLASLRGKLGTFLLGDPSGTTPRGSLATGTVLVNGAQDAQSETISIDGLPTSTNNLLLPGDYLQLGSGSTASLHKVLVAVNSNSGGQADVEIWPAVRRDLVDNEAVTYLNTVGRFRLAQDVSWSIGSDTRFSTSFTCVEAF